MAEVDTKETEKSITTPISKGFEKYNTISLFVAAVSVGAILIIYSDECRTCFRRLEEPPVQEGKRFWVFGKNVESGYLRHVFEVLTRLGYKQGSNESEWDLLWAHDYPFTRLYPQLSNLKAHQKINHLPGCGYITNKVDLATSRLKYIPPAFKLPRDKGEFLEYAARHPNATFVQKNNDHRNIKVKAVSDIELGDEGTFVQEFVDKPLLVSGHKFDIGIYTIVTSIDPLRVYIYNGDVLFRFCPIKYYPFDPENLDKYVVGDDYLPIWEVPALSYYYNELGFGMKETVNAHLRSRGKNPERMWLAIEDAIRLVILDKEPKILGVLSKFKSKRNFFEMMRFDFVVDEDLNVYLLEANMSPNLSSAHFPPNQLLYEQVLYNMLGLLGLGERLRKDSLASRSAAEDEMLVAEKNLVTFPEECSSRLCKSGCSAPVCQLCRPCLSVDTLEYLREAYREHLDKGDCKRIFPPSLGELEMDVDLEQYSAENQLQYRWFLGKCKQDKGWC